jgi:hypothetical protein
MAPKKLTEADKTVILSLYRQPQETTSTLADRYGVSNSTISRLLKSSLPEDEYSLLIQQKRGATDKAAVAASPEPDIPQSAPPDASAADPADSESMADQEIAIAPLEVSTPHPTRPQRRRSQPSASPEPAPTQLSLPDPDPPAIDLDSETSAKPARPVLKATQSSVASAAPDGSPAGESDLEATDLDGDEDWDDAVLGDDYDDDEDDGDDEPYPWEGGDRSTPHMEIVEITPLTAEVLPPLCYVVVERTSSELVVLPLKTFADLGQIPEAEEESRTLPVFENHNVARRFSRRNQRVVKVPDGSLLQTTSPYLQAKGITRLFIDGQVFSLGDPSVVVLGNE